MKVFSKVGVFFIGLFLLAACGNNDEMTRDEIEGLGNAVSNSDESVQALADVFNGTSDEKAAKAADVAATNTQTSLLVGILGVAILILLVVLLKNKKKNN